MAPKEELFTVKQVADYLDVNARTIYEWCYAGHMPYRRIGPTGRSIRIAQSDLDAYLERSRYVVA